METNKGTSVVFKCCMKKEIIHLFLNGHTILGPAMSLRNYLVTKLAVLPRPVSPFLQARDPCQQQPRSRGLIAPGGKMRDPWNEVGSATGIYRSHPIESQFFVYRS